MIPAAWLEQAAQRVAPHIRKTPLTVDSGENLYIKWENRQETGSFKIRGAVNKVLSLEPWESARGLVAASAGNHGQGVALAGSLVGARVIIFCSEHAVPAKIEAMRARGAEVRTVPGGYGEAEQSGLAYAAETGATWISPYNDGQIIAGQATIALEILQEQPALASATWVVPVGGGGLISGIGSALSGKPARLVGVQSEASPYLYLLYHTGSAEGFVDLPSLADGLSGPVQEGSLTIPLARSLADDFILVSEAEIAQAVVAAWQRYGEKIEGSAAAALAAVLYGKVPSRPAVVIISGGNIQPEVHEQLLKGRYGLHPR